MREVLVEVSPPRFIFGADRSYSDASSVSQRPRPYVLLWVRADDRRGEVSLVAIRRMQYDGSIEHADAVGTNVYWIDIDLFDAGDEIGRASCRVRWERWGVRAR